MKNQLKTTIRKALILSLLSGAIVFTLPTKTIAQILMPATVSQECAAADWPALKVQIKTRYNEVQSSLNQILNEVKDTTIPQEQVNSEKQIESIDALLSCLKTSSTSSQKFEKSINLLTDFKTKFLDPIKPGLAGENFSTLKKNLGLQESDSVVIPKFEETFNQFKTDLDAEIQNLLTTSPDIDPSKPPNSIPPDPEITPIKQEDSDSFRLRPWQTFLVIILGLICLVGVIFLISSDRSNHSHHRRSRQTSKLGLPDQKIDERSEISYLKQKIDNLERQMASINQRVDSVEHNQQSSQNNLAFSSNPNPQNIQSTLHPVNPTSAPLTAAPSSTQQLTQAYNKNPGSLQGIGVSETEESFNQRRSGLNVSVVLHPASNPSFLVIQDQYLVPDPKSKVTTHKLNTIEALFDCSNFRSGAEIELIEPAIVSPLSNNQWKLNQRGKLKFL